jgi:hypothetical protein
MSKDSERNIHSGKEEQENDEYFRYFLILSLPPLAEQHEIVRRVGALFARADAVDREVAAATKRAEALMQAVLGKAFAGKL